MTTVKNIRSIAILGAIFLLGLHAPAQAGSVDELKHEISFLAKKLLDKSGKDTVTVEQPAMVKPFIGICTELSTEGVRLTCITPGQSAAAAGLQTGDLVTSINDISFVSEKRKASANHDAYYKLVKTMKIGDELTFNLIRSSKTMSIDVTVGSVKHPAYTLTVRKK